MGRGRATSPSPRMQRRRGTFRSRRALRVVVSLERRELLAGLRVPHLQEPKLSKLSPPNF